MEESYETFEEELGPPRADPPPQKPVRQIRRPEMYTPRKVREEVAAVPQQPRAEPRTPPREPSFPRATSLQKAMSIQNLCQIETPWENVTLNRCLFVAITILVLTSGFQRLHETLRGQGRVEEEEDDVGVTVRRPGALRHRGQPAEPEPSLWDIMFWWLPDLDDEDDDEEDEDDDEGVERGKPKKGAASGALRGLRNKPLPDKKLMKQREGKLKERRAKKGRDDEEIKGKKEQDKTEEPEDEEDEEEEGNEETVAKKSKKMEGQKAKKKSQKG